MIVLSSCTQGMLTDLRVDAGEGQAEGPPEDARPEDLHDARPEVLPPDDASPEVVYLSDDAGPEVLPPDDARPEVLPAEDARPEDLPQHVLDH